MSLHTIPLPAHLTSTRLSCEAPPYRVVTPDLPLWKTLPEPMPTGEQRWQTSNAFDYTRQAPSPDHPVQDWTLSAGTWPNISRRTLYINLSDTQGYVNRTENPPVSETLDINVPRDPTTYRVTVILNKLSTELDTPIPLNRAYAPQPGDVFRFTFISLNHNPYSQYFGSPVPALVWGIDSAGGLCFGNFTGYYPQGLFVV